MFISPVFLLLFVLVAALAAAYVVLQLRRKQFVARFSNVELLGSIAPRRPGWRRHLTFALLLIALSVLSLGAAKPAQVGQGRPRERHRHARHRRVAVDAGHRRHPVAHRRRPQRGEVLRRTCCPTRINLGLVTFGGAATLNVPADARSRDGQEGDPGPHRPAPVDRDRRGHLHSPAGDPGVRQRRVRTRAASRRRRASCCSATARTPTAGRSPRPSPRRRRNTSRSRPSPSARTTAP